MVPAPPSDAAARRTPIRNRAMAGTLRVSYATPTADAVAELIAGHYDLPLPLDCGLLNRGFNDVFAVRAGDGRRYVLRLSGRPARGVADIAAETRFLAWLDAAGVPVAAALPTRDGELFTGAELPQGPRPAVLFHHAEGRNPAIDAPEDAKAQGVTLARLHTAAESFPDREDGHYRLDLDHLLHRQLAAVSALRSLTAGTRDLLTGLASRLAASVTAMDELSRTRCHGDCHGLNARIATEGPAAGEARFFDFDDGGFGYLSYDLAVHLWAQVSFGRRRYDMWHAFIAGYRSARPITRADFAAVTLFVAIRHIWLMGEYAGQIMQWGSENLSAAWLDRQADFLRSWEAEKLIPGLFRLYWRPCKTTCGCRHRSSPPTSSSGRLPPKTMWAAYAQVPAGR